MKVGKAIYLFFITVLSCFCGETLVYSQIIINEFQAYNASDYLDPETGNYSDWLELYNEGSSSISLGGYSISNDLNDPRKWTIPSGVSLPAKGFLVLWADKLDQNRHMNFSLKGKEGKIVLYNASNELVDSVSYNLQISNISYGRSGSDRRWGFLNHSTPGSENSIHLNSIELCQQSEVHLPGGFYNGNQSVSISNQISEAEIRYTLDGSQPTRASHLYTGAISIDQTTVLRVISFQADLLPSKIVTHTYFIDEVFTLPVVSIATDNENLWDDKLGIYTQDNCEKDWERQANIELYELDGSRGFSYQVGMNVHGGYNQILPMKSLAIRARNKYETDKIEYKLFRDKELDSFSSFILRNSGNDWAYSMFRDALMQNIVKERMDIDYQEYQPTIVYINGEYWGIHNIREKMNEYFMEGNHDVDPDSVDILEKGYIVAEGEDSHYRELLKFMTSHDMRNQEDYLVVNDRVDIEELINYQIAQIYFKNQDWPKGNIKKWRPQQENGKWRWLLYDTDWGFGLFEHYDNMVEWTLAQNKWYLNFNTMLFRNNDYKYDFLQCFQSHMNTTFQPERVIQIIDSLKTGIELEIPGHISKWGEPQSVSSWETEVDDMKDFASNRLAKIKSELSSYFYVRSEYQLSLDVENPEGGSVQICNVDMPDNFSGKYYRNLPIRVEAIPSEGYHFIRWSGESTSTQKNIDLTLSSDAVLTAHFDQQEPYTYLQINELSSCKGNAIIDEYGDSVDWVEIINRGEKSVDLNGLYLSDSILDLPKHMIMNSQGPLILLPDSMIVFYADNDEEEGAMHLNFKLSNSGETLTLAQKIGEEMIILDSVSYDPQLIGVTCGRIPPEGNEWQSTLPTPGEPNMKIPKYQGIFINEFSASNIHILANSQGDFCDWIEIYNDNEFAIDMGGMFLTDSLPDKTKYRIPMGIPDSTTVPPKGFLLLWADKQPQLGALHLNFGLKRNGEQIGLVQMDGLELIDSFGFDEQYQNSSYSRFPDGSDQWQHLLPTPGAENEIPSISNIYINEFSASNELLVKDNFGDYNDWIEIYNDNDIPIDIGGLFITDSLADGRKYRIPTTKPDSTTIRAKEYLILWADSDPDQGVLHLDFKLSRKGESVGLVQYNGKDFLDSISYNEQYINSSLSVYEGLKWIPAPSSPGHSNYKGTPSNIYINEFSASNESFMSDEFGGYDDWIEIYNGNDFPIDMGGLFLTDSLADGKKSRIPTTAPDSTTIQAYGYLLLWADNQDNQGVLHLDFGLSRRGEQIGLIHYNGETSIDSISYGEQYKNSSSSRYPDGNSYWSAMNSTPGVSNIRDEFVKIYINEFKAGVSGGITDDSWLELFNGNNYELDVGGLYLTNSLENPGFQRISDLSPDLTTIPPGGFLTFGTNPGTQNEKMKLNFSLNTAGGEIGLSKLSEGRFEYLDSIVYSYQGAKVSTGRVRDGISAWTHFSSPSPGQSNSYTTSSFEEFEKTEFYLYPNPVSNGVLYFSQLRDVILYNQWGSTVRREEHTDQLELNGLSVGMYILQTDQGETLRVIIQ